MVSKTSFMRMPGGVVLFCFVLFKVKYSFYFKVYTKKNNAFNCTEGKQITHTHTH